MIVLPETITLPMKLDEHGVIRVSGTRVTLDTLLAYYHQGDSPEDLHDSFDVVPLEDIFAVISYYVAHREEVDTYLKANEEKAERIRQFWESQYPPKVTRAELLARLEAKKQAQGNE